MSAVRNFASWSCAVALVVAGVMPSPAHAAERDPGVRKLRGQLGEANASLREVAAKANAALERSQQAAQQQESAEEVAAGARRKLDAARHAVAARKSELEKMAAAAYRSGGSPELRTLAVFFGSNAENVLRRADVLNHVGGEQREVLQQAAIERRGEELATQAAEAASRDAEKAAAVAADARRTADELVEQQRAVVTGVSERLTTAEAEAKRRAEAIARAERLARAERIAEAARRAEAERLAAQARRRSLADQARRRQLAAAQADQQAEQLAEDGDGGLATCTGRSTRGYSNGRIPAGALCPLWGAAGHRLRADAAASFSAMSRAYAEEFGRPICVTDSYRSYAAQVDVKGRKPGLTATPGTSQHGWGLAVDLCDGAESDGTPANNWLRSNAGRFRWYHPSWADAGGNGPYEPWHWEYAG